MPPKQIQAAISSTAAGVRVPLDLIRNQRASERLAATSERGSSTCPPHQRFAAPRPRQRGLAALRARGRRAATKAPRPCTPPTHRRPPAARSSTKRNGHAARATLATRRARARGVRRAEKETHAHTRGEARRRADIPAPPPPPLSLSLSHTHTHTHTHLRWRCPMAPPRTDPKGRRPLASPMAEATECVSLVSPTEPEHLCCPVTRGLFRDPVFVPESGTTYEREALKSFWATLATARGAEEENAGGEAMGRGHAARPRRLRDPFTNRLLRSTRVYTNWDKRREVQAFLSEHPDFVPPGWDGHDVPPPAEGSESSTGNSGSESDDGACRRQTSGAGARASAVVGPGRATAPPSPPAPPPPPPREHLANIPPVPPRATMHGAHRQARVHKRGRAHALDADPQPPPPPPPPPPFPSSTWRRHRWKGPQEEEARPRSLAQPTPSKQVILFSRRGCRVGCGPRSRPAWPSGRLGGRRQRA